MRAGNPPVGLGPAIAVAIDLFPIRPRLAQVCQVYVAHQHSWRGAELLLRDSLVVDDGAGTRITRSSEIDPRKIHAVLECSRFEEMDEQRSREIVRAIRHEEYLG